MKYLRVQELGSVCDEVVDESGGLLERNRFSFTVVDLASSTVTVSTFCSLRINRLDV